MLFRSFDSVYETDVFAPAIAEIRRLSGFNLLRPYIRYMHIKDSVATGRKAQRDTGFDTITDAHRPAGYGDGDLKRIVTALYEDGYEGFFSIEPHLSHNDAIPGSGADKFAVAVKAIKDLIAQVEAEHAPAQQ